MAKDPKPIDPEKYKQEIARQFDALSPEERRNVMNWGTAAGRGEANAMLTYQSADFPALQQLMREVGTAQQAGLLNQGLVNDQFSKLYPSGVKVVNDPFFSLNLKRGVNPDEVALKVMNTNRSGALAEQMLRLEDQYPGITRRMVHLGIGRTGNEGWNAMAPYLKEPGDPAGAVPYYMGLPAEASALRGAGTEPRLSPELGHSGGFFAADDPNLYPGLFESTATHEIGHAVQGSMHDFIRGLDENRSGAARDAGQAYRALVGRLGGEDASFISRYARQGQLHEGIGAMGSVAGGAASKEPFAELFSLARSPQGMDYLKTGNPKALQAIVGQREGSSALKMADRVSELNSVEGKLRNVGFSEVGAVAPDLALQMGFPALTGLLASKTHGNVRAALSGAALGSGIGSLAGPEGTLVGGALGAGAGLARQLL